MDMHYSAALSDCGKYRYSLTRRWDDTRGRATFVMLNPSTADHRVDDPTIRRCLGFAREWGLGSLIVVNLFAYRATDPGTFTSGVPEIRPADPIGPGNDSHLKWVIEAVGLHSDDRLVFAWGSSAGSPLKFKRVDYVIGTAAGFGVIPYCLGKTKVGSQPRHPLYVKSGTPLEAF